MDGVIFNTEVLARRLWREVFKEYGYGFSDTTYKKLIGRSMPAAYRILSEEYGSELPIKEMAKKQDILWQEATAEAAEKKEGIHEVLEYLQSRGIPCAVGSSTNHVEVEKRLEQNGLRDYFDVVVGGDYVENAKPAPDIFLKCAEYLGVDPRNCLVIEDSVNGLRAAKAAGMQAVLIPDLIPFDEIDRSLFLVAYPSLTELQEFFKGIISDLSGILDPNNLAADSSMESQVLPIQKKIDDSGLLMLYIARNPWILRTFHQLKIDEDSPKTRRCFYFDPIGTLLFYFLMKDESPRLAKKGKRIAYISLAISIPIILLLIPLWNAFHNWGLS